MAAIRLAGISGSIRAASFCTAVLRGIQHSLDKGIVLDIHPLDDVPLYNQDVDADAPPASVLALRNAIAEAEGVIICSPEYNYGMSGVLKNALDWASRPYGQAALLGKPVLIMSASPAFTGGVRAQAQLIETLNSTMSRLARCPQIVIGEVHKKIHDGRLTDEATLKFALGAIRDFAREIG